MPNYNPDDRQCQQFLGKNLPHYHKIWLNTDIHTPGQTDWTDEFEYLGLSDTDFPGKNVLDIGALDGVHSFNAERLGAKRVLAVDVEDVEDYDWGYAGPPGRLKGKGEIKNRVFQELKTFFASNVERQRLTVYELKPEEVGQFDIVFFYGVLYHLRHPLLAFDRIRPVCRDMICVETHVAKIDPALPYSFFYLEDELDGACTNWTGPSEACVVHWMKDAGFEKIYYEKKPARDRRQKFIGFVDKDRVVNDAMQLNFSLADEEYFQRSRQQVLQRIKPDHPRKTSIKKRIRKLLKPLK